MTEREKLIELLNFVRCNAECCAALDGGRCGNLDYLDRCQIETIADHLLANKCHALPCDIGDTVYTNCCMQGWYFRDKDKPYKAKIVFIGLNGVDNFMNVDFGNGHMLQFPFSQIGKTVFLTKETALKVRNERV